ncbi:hypothetical protein NDU88_004762 [Pleurodeles waltl]|uniref:Uncharacterized protein n=1 Tax=Pleurodeles waltl TaxID=8319 RepID=A0AAV7SJQ3_PLEWA|nr:hypothetical protein NDU88_004762 [Pleurodeles waltl]
MGVARPGRRGKEEEQEGWLQDHRERRSRERRRSRKNRSETEERKTERTPWREPQAGGPGRPESGLSPTTELRTPKQPKETGITRRPGKRSATACHASGEAWQIQV